ncbi:MAG: hypothetical protein CM1200mP22_22600 [Dehalococcoidia bacterium]|nr:MAG: hypothetical protein CM1200mP22_22600 [Dehalococcoidia bacterium]
MTKSNKMPSMLPTSKPLKPRGCRPYGGHGRAGGYFPDKIIRLKGMKILMARLQSGFSPRDYENYNYYPDPGQRNLRRVLSGYLNVEPEKIVAGKAAMN